MSAPSSVDTLSLAPHVAAAIVEHAKRRVVASGYLIGQKTVDSIQITDYFPYTSTDKPNPIHVAERYEIIRSFTSSSIIGWYSACCSKNPDGSINEKTVLWSKSPATIFIGEKDSGDVGRNAIHLHCELPHLANEIPNSRPAISWDASFTLIKRGGADDATNVMKLKELKVLICAHGHEATNVVLNHVRNQVLFGGESPAPTPLLLNLDTVAFQNSGRPQAASDALLALNKQLKELIKGNIAPVPSSSSTPADVDSIVEEIRLLVNGESGQKQSSRDDALTHGLKDALMIKCLSTLLKKNLSQIDYLSSQYPDPNNNSSRVGGAANSANKAGGNRLNYRNNARN